MTLATVLIGAVQSTEVALSAMVGRGETPRLCITLPPDKHGRHSDYVDLAPLCAQHAIPLVHADDVNAPAILREVAGIAPEVIFVIGWSRLVGADFRALASRGVIGYHPTLLPRHRGRAALAWTILLAPEETGGTLFWIDDGVDTGPIAAQTRFALTGEEYLGELLERQMVALAPMVAGLVDDMAAGRFPAVPQDEAGASYLAVRRAADGEIAWSDTAADVARLVRAVSRPYPGAFSFLPDGRRVIIWRAREVDRRQWHALTGQVFEYADGFPIVRCADRSSLLIEDYEIAPAEGKAPVLKGQPRLGRPAGGWS